MSTAGAAGVLSAGGDDGGAASWLADGSPVVAAGVSAIGAGVGEAVSVFATTWRFFATGCGRREGDADETSRVGKELSGGVDGVIRTVNVFCGGATALASNDESSANTPKWAAAIASIHRPEKIGAFK